MVATELGSTLERSMSTPKVSQAVGKICAAALDLRFLSFYHLKAWNILTVPGGHMLGNIKFSGV